MVRRTGYRAWRVHPRLLVGLAQALIELKGDAALLPEACEFSQDGDIAPIPELLRLAERWDALLYVDDCHGAGVLGASGGGILEHFQAASDRLIYMATFGNAYGSIGATSRPMA